MTEREWTEQEWVACIDTALDETQWVSHTLWCLVDAVGATGVCPECQSVPCGVDGECSICVAYAAAREALALYRPRDKGQMDARLEKLKALYDGPVI